MKSPNPKTSTTSHVPHAREVGGAAAGELAGAVLGSAAGPVGAIVGMVVGGLVGTLVGDVLEEEAERAHAHDEELDKEICVSGGDIGAPRGTTTPSAPPKKSE